MFLEIQQIVIVCHTPGTMSPFTVHVYSVEHLTNLRTHTFSNLLHAPSGPADFLTLTLMNTFGTLFIHGKSMIWCMTNCPINEAKYAQVVVSSSISSEEIISTV